MEVLGYNFETKEEDDIVTSLLESFTLIYVDYYIAKLVVQLRKKYTIKLPDAIICGSALAHNALLISNDNSLTNIKELSVLTVSV